MTDAFININNLSKHYKTPAGDLNVLRGINLNIQPGEFVALLGASGSGKTTLLNMLTGIDTPTSGDVTIGGFNITKARQGKLTQWRAKNVGIIFQFFQLLPTLSVAHNIVAPMDFGNVWKPRERYDIALDLLNQFGIKDQAHKTPDMLSGGQQQRVAIARALANNPALIIGDEPTGNLDLMSARNVFNFFRQLADQGSTIIIVTHDRELVKEVPTILEMHNGLIERTTAQNVGQRRSQELKAIRRSQEMSALRLSNA